jgi:hypothetical protein
MRLRENFIPHFQVFPKKPEGAEKKYLENISDENLQ